MDNKTFDNLKAMFNNTKNIADNTNDSKFNSTCENSSNTDIPNIDFETIIKFKNILDTVNSGNDQRANLLRSLKPYLRESKQKNIEQYIQFLNISKVFNLFSKR